MRLTTLSKIIISFAALVVFLGLVYFSLVVLSSILFYEKGINGPLPTVPEETVIPEPTTTPTILNSRTTATFKTYEKDKTFTIQFTNLPNDIEILSYPANNSFSTWESIGLSRSGVTLMMFNSPYEINMPITFNSKFPIPSKVYTNLYRITTSESSMAATNFVVGYATNDAIFSIPNSAEEEGYPTVKFRSDKYGPNRVAVYCANGPEAIALCDSVMNTVKIAIK